MERQPEGHGVRALRRAVALVIAVGLCASTANRAAAGTTFICHELDAHITNRGVTIDPPNPRVGDQIDIEFDIDVFVYSAGPAHLSGADPLLTGNTMVDYGSRPSFQLTAGASGTATLSLSITYLTEDACQDDEGHMFYTIGRYHTLNLEPFELFIAEQGACPGDCDDSGNVTVDEILWGVRVALAQEAVDSCSMLDRNGDGRVAVDDVVAAIYAALNGCDSLAASAIRDDEL